MELALGDGAARASAEASAFAGDYSEQTEVDGLALTIGLRRAERPRG